MRFAILSDIHSNLEALEAVLADARAQSCTHFVCLGDVVGYNANPSECVKLIRELDCPVVKGNHDEQASIVASTEAFNELAEEAIGWTRDHLSADDKAWLADLRLTRQVRDFTIVHATLDSPGRVGLRLQQSRRDRELHLPAHHALFFGTPIGRPLSSAKTTTSAASPSGRIVLDPGKKYFINPGSIGQPRDRDWRAAYCIFHTDRQVVEQRRVEYDLKTAQNKIRQARPAGPSRRPARRSAGRARRLPVTVIPKRSPAESRIPRNCP